MLFPNPVGPSTRTTFVLDRPRAVARIKASIISCQDFPASSADVAAAWTASAGARF
jgi:hypothetical protein